MDLDRMKEYKNIMQLKSDLNNKTQFLILIYIILFSPVRLKDLADFLKSNFGLTKGALYQNLNFLLENGFIERLSDIEALKFRSENRRIIPSIFESNTKVEDMAPFGESGEHSEEDVKMLMEFALISLDKEEALTLCWNAIWFMTAIKDKIKDVEKAESVIQYFRNIRKRIIAEEIHFNGKNGKI
ncbi:MAG: hypothetical protein ACXQTP_01445 [Candidatus Methanofastidiosia archaeon]